MEGKQLTYKWRLRMIIIILAAGVIIKCMGPLAFVRDGLLTRMRVDDYLMQWDMGATRRHEAGIKDVYLVYFGFEEVSLQKEIMGKGYDMEIEKIMPFIYHWKHNVYDDIFRVNIGEKKYYYTTCST